MTAYFKTKTASFVSSVIYYWCLEAGIDLSLLTIIRINAEVIIKLFAHYFSIKRLWLILKTTTENIIVAAPHLHIRLMILVSAAVSTAAFF